MTANTAFTRFIDIAKSIAVIAGCALAAWCAVQLWWLLKAIGCAFGIC